MWREPKWKWSGLVRLCTRYFSPKMSIENFGPVNPGRSHAVFLFCFQFWRSLLGDIKNTKYHIAMANRRNAISNSDTNPL
jgi:hypothetical protein